MENNRIDAPAVASTNGIIVQPERLVSRHEKLAQRMFLRVDQTRFTIDDCRAAARWILELGDHETSLLESYFAPDPPGAGCHQKT